MIKKLASNSMIYGLSGILQKILNLILIPLFSKILLPNDYAIINLTGNFFIFLTSFTVLGLDSSAARWYYDNDNDEYKKTVISNWFWAQLVLGLFFFIIIIIFSSNIASLLVNNNNKWLIVLPAIGYLSTLPAMVFGNLLRFQQKAKFSVIYNIIIVLISFAINLYLIKFLKLGVIGYLLGSMISIIIQCVFSIFYLKNWIKLKSINISILKDMFRFAIPLIPMSVFFWLLNSSSTFFLKYFKGTEEIGIFNFGLTISSIISLITNSFQTAWGPFAFSISNNKDAKSVYAKVSLLFACIVFLASLCIGLFAKELLHEFTTETYEKAYISGGILTYNAVMYSFVYIFSIGLGIVKDNKSVAKAIYIGGISNVLLFVLIIPYWGKEGAALSMLISNTIMPIVVYKFAQKKYYIDYPIKQLIFLFLMSLLLYSIGINFFTEINIINIILKLVLIFVYLILISFTLYYNNINILDFIKNKKIF